MEDLINKILTNIIKKQNIFILKEIAKQYNKDEEYMMNMYNRSTFYKVDSVDKDLYKIIKK